MANATARFRMTYECLHCGIVWTQAWSAVVNDKCECGREIEPYHIQDCEDE